MDNIKIQVVKSKLFFLIGSFESLLTSSLKINMEGGSSLLRLFFLRNSIVMYNFRIDLAVISVIQSKILLNIYIIYMYFFCNLYSIVDIKYQVSF